MAKQCVMYWGNTPAEGGGNFTLQAGITPSTGMLRFTLGQASRINQLNTFTLTDLTTVNRPFRNCRVTRATVNQSGGGGRYYEVTFQDRRWMWGERCFAAYGEYNHYDHTRYGINNAQSPQQLAALLLQALGETSYDVSALPSGVAGPHVTWDAAEPAVELQLLCEMYGCLVTLSPSDRVVIARDGYGQTPRADSRQMDYTASTEPPIIPAALVFEGGKTHIQHDLYLKPVALEPDPSSPYWKRYVSIYNVSYASSLAAGLAGWGGETPGLFSGISAVYREDAKRDVWHVYQIGDQIQLPIPPNNLANRTNGKRLTVTQQSQLTKYFQIAINQAWRVLPYNLEQNQTSTANVPKAAEVLGYRWLGNANGNNTFGYTEYADIPSRAFNWNVNIHPLSLNAGQITVPEAEYTLDPENGLVFFKNPTYFESISTGRIPAVMRLRTSFPLRDPTSAAHLCQQVWKAPGSPIATNIAKLLKRSDSWLEYDAEGNNNANDFLSQANYYMAEELNTYSIGRGYSAPYKGFVTDIPVDGVVRTVVWDCSPDSGGMTHIDYNMERPESYATLAEVTSRRMATYYAMVAAELKRKQNRKKRGQP